MPEKNGFIILSLIIVFALFFTGTPRGEAFALTADTDSDVIFNANTSTDNFGQSVGSAGDFNGDGIQDVIVGAQGAENNSNIFSGRAYIFFGNASPGSPLEANTHADVIIDGPIPALSRQNFGWSVNSAGDFNGDGFDDIIVGENNVSDLPSTYIFFGRDTGGSQLLLQAETDADVIIRSTTPASPSGSILLTDRLGFSVSTAGDWNNDGVEDVIIGAPSLSVTTSPGHAYLFYGDKSIASQTVLQDTDADVVLTGRINRSQFGISVSSAGDFNGDGINDVVVGASQDANPGSRAGSAFIFFGRNPGANPLNLNAATDSDVILDADSSQDQFGTSVSSAGDFDGDGKSDVIVGAWSDVNQDGDAGSGKAFIFRGRDTGGSKPSINAVDADIILDGEGANDFLGRSVGGGDFNNDGLGDVMVGASQSSSSTPGTGKAYVFLGGNSCKNRIDAGNANIILHGQDLGDRFGDAVTLGADFNNDNMKDAVVGAEWDGNKGVQAGRVFTFFGSSPVHQLKVTQCPSGAPNQASPGQDVAVTAAVVDNLGHSLNFSWDADCSAWSTSNGEFNDPSLQNPIWRGPANTTGAAQDCEISILIDDGANGLAQTLFYTQTVTDGTGPIHTLDITQTPSGSPNPVDSEQGVSLSVQASDSLDHALNYSWSADCSDWSPSNGTFNNVNVQNPVWTAPENTTGSSQNCGIEVTVDDGAEGLNQQANLSQEVNSAPTGPGILSVENLTDFNSSGSRGGPFNPPSMDYVLTNQGGSPLVFAVNKTNDTWFSLSPSSDGGMTSIGTLQPGESKFITVSIAPEASLLFVGNFSGTVFFTNATNGMGDVLANVNLDISLFQLAVTPFKGLDARGQVGGPFTISPPGSPFFFPPTQSYLLENNGGADMDYVVSRSQNWVSISPSTDSGASSFGTLAPGASTTVVVGINENANPLCKDHYSQIVSFINSTNGSGNQTRAANLSVESAEVNEPIVTVPDPITIAATGKLTPLTQADLDPNNQATAIDDTDGVIQPTAVIAGDFPLGDSFVVWEATDCSGNVGVGTPLQKVTLEDDNPPVVTAPPSIIIEAEGTITKITEEKIDPLGKAKAEDNEGDVILGPFISSDKTLECTVDQIPCTFQVRWSGVDSSLNVGEAFQTVTVVDTTRPEFNVPPDIEMKVSRVPVFVDLGTATAQDLVDPSPVITNNTPVDSEFPLGETLVVWQVIDEAGNFNQKFQTVTITLKPKELAIFEVLQVSQDPSNSVPLIKDKNTLVRVYFKSVDSSTPQVYPELIAFRDGVKLPETLIPLNFGARVFARPNIVDLRATQPNSRQLQGLAANFQLPASWTHGDVTFEVVFSNFDPVDCSNALGSVTDDCKLTVNFIPMPALEIKMFKISFIPGEGDPTTIPSDTDVANQEKRILAQFPVSQIDRYPSVLELHFRGIGGTPTWEEILDALATMREIDGCTPAFGICNWIYYGVVSDTNSTLGADAGGMGMTPGQESAGLVRNGNSTLRLVSGQEIGHNFGMGHTLWKDTGGGGFFDDFEGIGPCGAPISNEDEPTFPYIFTVPTIPKNVFNSSDDLVAGDTGLVSTLGPVNTPNSSVLGWDSDRDRMISPLTNFDTMSYCGPRFAWPSKFTYSRFKANINALYPSLITPSSLTGGSATATISLSTETTTTSTNSTASSTEESKSDYTFIRGFIGPEADIIQFNSVGLLTDVSVQPEPMPEGDYILQLLDESDNILDEISFQPAEMGDHIGPSEPGGTVLPPLKIFSIKFPFNPDLKEMRFFYEGQIIGAIQASNNAPKVKVISPNGGEILSGNSMTIKWSGEDKDKQDLLTYNVQFSPDGGNTWVSLAVNYGDTTLQLGLNQLPETQSGLIRVQISDGFLIASDTSNGTFTTPNSPPNVIILTPYESQVFGGEQTLVFKAISHDVEEGSLADKGLFWESDIDGFLGEGHNLTALASDLTPGDHNITLTGTDRHGAMGTNHVRVFVVGEVFPPILMANINADKDTLWPPEHKMIPVHLDVDVKHLPELDVPDCQIVEVTSNEPVKGKGSGKTSPDWIITGSLSVDLRAERSGKGKGREYTITIECSASDGETNSTATDTVVIKVPRSKDGTVVR